MLHGYNDISQNRKLIRLDPKTQDWGVLRHCPSFCDNIVNPPDCNNKAGITATLVACVWAGAVLEKVTRASGQEPFAQKAQKRRKSNRSPKGNTWSLVSDTRCPALSDCELE